MGMDKKTITILLILCLVIAFMDITGLPCVLLRIRIADVDPVIIPLMINFCLIGIMAFLTLRVFRISYPFGFTANGLAAGLKKYAPVESLAYCKDNKTVIAILVSSLVFGLGHIPGMIGMGIAVIAFKVISTIGMGIYFGTIYKKTNNIWVPIIMHALIDVFALPYCFTLNIRYEPVSLVILIITYTALALYCGLLLRKNQDTDKEKL